MLPEKRSILCDTTSSMTKVYARPIYNALKEEADGERYCLDDKR